MDGMFQFKEKFQKFMDVEGLTGQKLYNFEERGLNCKLLPTKNLASK